MIKLSAHELDLSPYVRRGDGIVTSQGTAEPQTLTEALVDQAGRIGPVSVFLGGGSFSKTFTPERHGEHRFTGYGAVGTHRALVKAGVLDIIPAHVSQVPAYLGESVPCDVAMVQVSPPRADGSFSYSLISDYPPDAVRKARVVIAEVNANAPQTECEIGLRPDDITVMVETDRSLLQVPAAEITALDRAIAAQVSPFISDRATLQIGAGAIPEAIIATLTDRRDLGLHTGVIGDAMLDLIERGVLTNAHKEVDAGISVTGALWGTNRLYRFVHRNHAVRLNTLGHTHAHETLSRLTRLVTVNSALEVDLTGQVNAEQVGNDYVGAVGGQIDFVRAGARAAQGASIIALPSTARGGMVTRIVSRLGGPVTTSRSEVDVVATEHGAVRLKGLPLRSRVKLMIGLAAEPFREQLARDAFDMYGVR